MSSLLDVRGLCEKSAIQRGANAKTMGNETGATASFPVAVVSSLLIGEWSQTATSDRTSGAWPPPVDTSHPQINVNTKMMRPSARCLELGVLRRLQNQS